MTGCDRCGAQALAAETTCPVCSLPLRTARGAGPGAPHIPVRRYGTVPLPPRKGLASAQGAGVASMAALGLRILGAALIAGGVGYWFW